MTTRTSINFSAKDYILPTVGGVSLVLSVALAVIGAFALSGVIPGVAFGLSIGLLTGGVVLGFTGLIILIIGARADRAKHSAAIFLEGGDEAPKNMTSKQQDTSCYLIPATSFASKKKTPQTPIDLVALFEEKKPVNPSASLSVDLPKLLQNDLEIFVNYAAAKLDSDPTYPAICVSSFFKEIGVQRESGYIVAFKRAKEVDEEWYFYVKPPPFQKKGVYRFLPFNYQTLTFAQENKEVRVKTVTPINCLTEYKGLTSSKKEGKEAKKFAQTIMESHFV